jgi:hypothetical protein
MKFELKCMLLGLGRSTNAAWAWAAIAYCTISLANGAMPSVSPSGAMFRQAAQ